VATRFKKRHENCREKLGERKRTSRRGRKEQERAMWGVNMIKVYYIYV
jgi:hypothetical protein